MNPVDNCNAIRPLLSINRFETGKLSSFWQLPIYPDISNQKIRFLRNRVRKQLLPLVKFFFNLKVENVLLQLAEIVEAEDHQMDQVANDFFIAFHNIGCYNFTNVSATHHNRYVWVSSINFIKQTSLQTSFTRYLHLPSLGYSLIHLDQLLVPQTLAAWQAILHLTGCASQPLPPIPPLPPLPPLPPSVVQVVWGKKEKDGIQRGGAPKMICGMWCVVCGMKQQGLSKEAAIPFVITSSCFVPVRSIRYAHVAPPSFCFEPVVLRNPYHQRWYGERSICSKLVIRWILTIFASLTVLPCLPPLVVCKKMVCNKGVKRKNMGCKAIPVSLSNRFAQPFYPTCDEDMPCSKLCINYGFGNRGSENMWYGYTKGGNYNKLQKLLLTKLMKQNSEFRKLALFSKTGSVRNVLSKKGSSNKKNSNKFIRKPVEKYVEDVLIYNFFLYFEMLKPEKKEIYWPIIISFLPTAFQRRVTKLFLINQDWKKIRYSQVFNFLAKKKKLC